MMVALVVGVGFAYAQGTPEKAVIRMLAATRELTGVDLAPLVYWAQDRSRLLKRRRQANPDKRSRAGADTDLEAGLAARQRKVAQLIDHVDLFLSPSHTVAERVVDWGIPRNRIVVSRYGIDITPFRDARDQERPDRPITFGYVGTLAPHKGVHVLLEAVRRLPAGSCKLLVFGSDSHFGDYGRMLRELAEERDVEFRGPLERARIGEAFAAIDCLVMPSLWLENSPVVIQEAFAAGVPVIASGQGGMAELIVDGRSGRLFKAGDIGALVLHMASILANPTTLRQWSVTMDAPRTIEDDAAQLEQIYGELLAGTWQPPATGGKGRRTARLRPAADDDDD